MADPVVLSGVLGPVGLAGVLQLAGSEMLTGVLTVPGARIELHQGSVVGVRTDAGIDVIMGVRDAFISPNVRFEVVTQPV